MRHAFSPPTSCYTLLQVSSLSSILLAVGRYSTLEKLYITSRSKRAMALWDQATSTTANIATAGAPGALPATADAGSGAAAGGGGGASGNGWLLMFYNSLLELLQQEASWLAGALPEVKGKSLLALVGAILNKVGAGMAGL